MKTLIPVLVEERRNRTTVNWQARDSVRYKLHNMVRILLRRYKYPPDKQDEAIDLVLKQVEALSNSW